MNDNIHKDHRRRVRKKFMENGLDGFAEHEVLELLLFYCYPRQDTNEIAHNMINEYGSLYNLLEADAKDIMNRCGKTESIAVLISLIPKLANLYFRSKWERQPLIMDNVKTAGRYAVSLFVGRTNEVLYAVLLDSRMRLNHVSLVAEGTLGETAVYPRKIVEEILKHQAASVILAHNHPSGTSEPSRADVETTQKIKDGLNFLSIKTTDSIIVAGDTYYSFASHGEIVHGY